MACPAFSFKPRSPGCSCGASSVNTPTANLCVCITCLIAGSSDSRLSRARAEAGFGRCSRGRSSWKRYCNEAEANDEEPVDRSWYKVLAKPEYR